MIGRRRVRCVSDRQSRTTAFVPGADFARISPIPRSETADRVETLRDTAHSADNPPMLALHVVTVLVSAGLLFLVQPMFARMVLPMLGGAPSVWNTALVFYQVTLLAGYAYAHFLTRTLGVRRQAIVHLVLVAAAFVCLPIAVPHGWSPPTDHSPVPWMLGLLAVGIGLPFFVVSTTGPLIQKWFHESHHESARDPYFLYAASNAGSMIGLLGYPLLIEPRLRLATQSAMWTTGYGLLAALIFGCAVVLMRNGKLGLRAGVTPTGGDDPPATGTELDLAEFDPRLRERITVPRRLWWVLLAFVPSSLMMGVTSHITTDVAAIPLLWVLPLALYLLSFILVFAKRPILPVPVMGRALPMTVLPLIIVMQSRALDPLRLIVALHLLVLFVAAMVCHGRLAADRPHPRSLTEFYLWLAVGGALGGVFNALIAPVAFHSVIEYPIALVLACLVMPPKRPLTPNPRAQVLDVVIPILVGGFLVAFLAVFKLFHWGLTGVVIALLFSLLAFPLYAFSRRPLRFGLTLAVILLVSPANMVLKPRMMYQERSFFGVLRVMGKGSMEFHDLIHGTTLHGSQRVHPLMCREALGYYHPAGPAGDVFNELPLTPGRRVAVAGLGTGGLAAYGRTGEHWKFFEIDPLVERIATDPKYFCFLSSCPSETQVVLGDARRSIAAAKDERFDLMVFDAYTSDAIPVHLITREAIHLYEQHLAPHGVMAFHLSNRYFDLVPVVARIADEAGLACRSRELTNVSPTVSDSLRLANSIYLVMARDSTDFGTLGTDPKWHTPRRRTDLRTWTDDYSSLLSVMK